MKHGFRSSLLQLSLGVALAALAAATPAAWSAEKAKAPAAEGAPKRDWYPFHGDVASVNKAANTISLKKQEGERVLRLDAKSELTRSGRKITAADVRPGDYAHGKLHKNAQGQEVILAAAFDAAPPAKGTHAPTKPAPPAK